MSTFLKIYRDFFRIFWVLYVAFRASRPSSFPDAATDVQWCPPSRRPRHQLWTMLIILLTCSLINPLTIYYQWNKCDYAFILFLNLDLHMLLQGFIKLCEHISNACLHYPMLAYEFSRTLLAYETNKWWYNKLALLVRQKALENRNFS